MLAFGVLQVPAALAHEERTVDQSVPAEGIAALDVGNQAGTVRVVGVDGATTVSVHAEIRDGLRSTGHEVRQEGDRLSPAGLVPDSGRNGARSTTRSRCRATCGPRFAPTGGSRSPTSTAGCTSASDASGSWPRRVAGDVTLRSDQGSIVATDADGRPGRRRGRPGLRSACSSRTRPTRVDGRGRPGLDRHRPAGRAGRHVHHGLLVRPGHGLRRPHPPGPRQHPHPPGPRGPGQRHGGLREGLTRLAFVRVGIRHERTPEAPPPGWGKPHPADAGPLQ